MTRLSWHVSLTRDHPREYGENAAMAISRHDSAGPSPRIRGELHPPALRLSEYGTIPANTGRICQHLRSPQTQRDHPREYGENTISGLAGLKLPGPSPRIRGECGWLAQTHARWGTIPANTGRMGKPTASLTFVTDHPREYGENWVPIDEPVTMPGPSPRIRGECSATPGAGGSGGTIPANTGRIISRTSQNG